MRAFQERRTVGASLEIGIILACVALASPWAAPLRQSLRPDLPRYVVIVASLVGVWRLVTGVVDGLGKRGGWSAAAQPVALGVSALLMALSFLPAPQEVIPRLLPLVGAAAFAVGAAALHWRTRERGDS